MAGKTQGERIVRLETYYVQVNDSLTDIKDHLATLNGRVAENSKFRVQQRAVYWVIAAAFGIAMAPLTAITIAVLT